MNFHDFALDLGAAAGLAFKQDLIMAKKNILISFIVCLCLFIFIVPSAHADDDTLKVGDAPPTILDSLVVYHKATKARILGSKTSVNLIVFFESDYDKKSILKSNMNSIQKEFDMKGLDVFLVCKDDIEKTSVFTKTEVASMVFTLVHTADGEVWQKWVDAAKMETMPLGFIFNQSKILWIGNPLEESLPAILRKAVNGKYDPQLIKKAQPMLDAARKSLQVRNIQEAYKHFDEVIELDPAFFVDIILERYKLTHKNQSDPTIAAEWIQKMAKKSGSDAAQNEIVNTIVNDPEIQKRDLESALIIANSIIVKNATMGLQAKALVYAAKKDWMQAIDLQTDAWMEATVLEKPMAKQRLEEYRAASTRVPVKNP